MITYEARYTEGTEPQICKIVTTGGGEEVVTNIVLQNEEEVKNVETMTDALIKQHIDNLILHAAWLGDNMEVYPDHEAPNRPWPIKNLKELLATCEKMVAWWNFAFFRDEDGFVNEASPIIVSSEEHESMHENEDHTHDPVTGEAIPNV